MVRLASLATSLWPATWGSTKWGGKGFARRPSGGEEHSAVRARGSETANQDSAPLGRILTSQKKLEKRNQKTGLFSIFRFPFSVSQAGSVLLPGLESSRQFRPFLTAASRARQESRAPGCHQAPRAQT